MRVGKGSVDGDVFIATEYAATCYGMGSSTKINDNLQCKSLE